MSSVSICTVESLVRVSKLFLSLLSWQQGLVSARPHFFFLFFSPCTPAEEEDDAGYLDVTVSDEKHPPPQLSPMPEGLSSHQVHRVPAASTLLTDLQPGGRVTFMGNVAIWRHSDAKPRKVGRGEK